MMPLHSAIFAFLHHIAAFLLFATLVVEFLLIQGEITASSARRLARTDAIFGISAGSILVIGLLRVFYFESGADYYFGNPFFLAKFGLFLVVGIISIYPTLAFLTWRRAAKAGQAPVVTPRQLRNLKLAIHTELLGLVLIILCAALMARGLTV
jgi:putative membrane protein